MSLFWTVSPVIFDSLIAVAKPVTSLFTREKFFVSFTKTPTVPCEVGPWRLEFWMVMSEEPAITTPFLPPGSEKSTPSMVRCDAFLSSTLEKVTFAPAASVITALW